MNVKQILEQEQGIESDSQASLCLKLPIAGTQERKSPTATAGKKEKGRSCLQRGPTSALEDGTNLESIAIFLYQLLSFDPVPPNS